MSKKSLEEMMQDAELIKDLTLSDLLGMPTRVEKLEAALQEIEGMDDPRQLIGEARHVARKALRREDTDK